MTTTDILPAGELVFKFSHEERPIEIFIDYSPQKTIFGYRVAGELQFSQEFRNLLGDPVVLNIPSNRDGPTLQDSYPEYATRIRFVKNLLYVWCAVQFAKRGLLGPYSPLLVARPEVEDYWNKEMLTIIIAPTLKCLYEARNYLKDLSPPIIKFCESAYREIDEFLSQEVDTAPIVDEVQFQDIFRERLRQITAAVNVRAIQTLQTSHIDQLRDMGDSISSLERMMKEMPQYVQHVDELRGLTDMQHSLAAKVEEIIQSNHGNKQDLLLSQTKEISDLKNTILDLQVRLSSLGHLDVQHSMAVQQTLEEHEDTLRQLETQELTLNSKLSDVQTKIDDVASKMDTLQKMTGEVNELRSKIDDRSRSTVNELEKHKTDVYSALQEVRNIVTETAKRPPTVVEIRQEVQSIHQPDPATLLNKKQRAILNRMYQ